MPLPKIVEAFAPAKINLTLHVTGRRADGYHLLDSLVVFVRVGDRLSLRPALRTRLTVTGPRAGCVPTGADNLAVRAADLSGVAVDIALEKHLPAAAGIGGGSSDAAAVLRGIAALTGAEAMSPSRALPLGADVPVCLAARPCRMRGIGERIDDVPRLPSVHLVLVNPGIAIPTGQVFAGLAHVDRSPMPDPPAWPDADALCAWLAAQRNDLEPAAAAFAPDVSETLTALRAQPGCALARMSGSGATCFGVFPDPARAAAATDALRKAAAPAWWVETGAVATTAIV